LFDVSFVVELKMQHALEGVMDESKIIRMDGGTKRKERDRLVEVTLCLHLL
jgi:hypothetical protein